MQNRIFIFYIGLYIWAFYCSAEAKGATYIDTLNHGREIRLILKDNNLSIFPTYTSSAFNKKETILSGKKRVSEGFRIQLMASKSVGKMREQKEKIESGLSFRAYINFDDPYYKIYVGDFTNRTDALKALVNLKNYGYSDAWIVKSKIFIYE